MQRRISTRCLAPMAVLPLVLSCGFLAPLRPLPGRDAGSGGDGAAAGAANDGTGVICDPSMPFQDAILVPGLNRDLGNEHRVHLSPDELTAYVSSGNPWQFSDIFVAKRAVTSEPFGRAQELARVNGPDGEYNASVTGNGLRIFIDSDRSKTGRIYTATRDAIGDPFPPPTEVTLDRADSEFDPYVVPDGSALYFISRSLNPDRYAIKRAPVDDTTVGAPVLVPVGTVPRWPVVSADELVLYFYEGEAADSSHGIWMARRASRELPFGDAKLLSELTAPDMEYPQWISPDGCRLYFGRITTMGFFLLVAERVRN